MPGPVRLMVFEGYASRYGAFGVLYRPMLQKGARGKYVVEAQDRLMQILARSIPGGADGIFGSNTEMAVREVQAQFGLRVDGIIGKDTWTLLLGQETLIGSGSGTPPPSTPPAPPSQNDGDIIVGDPNAPPAKDNRILFAGLAVAAVAAFVIFRK